MKQKLTIPVRVIDRPLSFFMEAYGFSLMQSRQYVFCGFCHKRFKVKEDSRLVWEMETHHADNHEIESAGEEDEQEE